MKLRLPKALMSAMAAAVVAATPLATTVATGTLLVAATQQSAMAAATEGSLSGGETLNTRPVLDEDSDSFHYTISGGTADTPNVWGAGASLTKGTTSGNTTTYSSVTDGVNVFDVEDGAYWKVEEFTPSEHSVLGKHYTINVKSGAVLETYGSLTGWGKVGDANRTLNLEEGATWYVTKKGTSDAWIASMALNMTAANVKLADGVNLRLERGYTGTDNNGMVFATLGNSSTRATVIGSEGTATLSYGGYTYVTFDTASDLIVNVNFNRGTSESGAVYKSGNGNLTFNGTVNLVVGTNKANFNGGAGTTTFNGAVTIGELHVGVGTMVFNSTASMTKFVGGAGTTEFNAATTISGAFVGAAGDTTFNAAATIGGDFTGGAGATTFASSADFGNHTLKGGAGTITINGTATMGALQLGTNAEIILAGGGTVGEIDLSKNATFSGVLRITGGTFTTSGDGTAIWGRAYSGDVGSKLVFEGDGKLVHTSDSQNAEYSAISGLAVDQEASIKKKEKGMVRLGNDKTVFTNVAVEVKSTNQSITAELVNSDIIHKVNGTLNLSGTSLGIRNLTSTSTTGITNSGTTTISGVLEIAKTMTNSGNLTITGTVSLADLSGYERQGDDAISYVDTTGAASDNGYTSERFLIINNSGSGTLTANSLGNGFVVENNSLYYRPSDVYHINTDTVYVGSDAATVTSGTIRVMDGATLTLAGNIATGVTLATAGTGAVHISGDVSSLGAAPAGIANVKVAGSDTATITRSLLNEATGGIEVKSGAKLTISTTETSGKQSISLGTNVRGTGTVEVSAYSSDCLHLTDTSFSDFNGTLILNFANHIEVGENSTDKNMAFGPDTHLVLNAGTSGHAMILQQSYASKERALTVASLSSGKNDQGEYVTSYIRGDMGGTTDTDSHRYLRTTQTTTTTYAGVFLTVSGQETHDPGLIMDGTGNLILTGGSTTGADLEINHGTVTFQGSGSWAGAIIVNADGTLQLKNGGALALTSGLTGTGGVTVATGGTLSVNSEMRNFTGAITVADGSVLKSTHENEGFTKGSVSVQAGGKLELQASNSLGDVSSVVGTTAVTGVTLQGSSESKRATLQVNNLQLLGTTLTMKGNSVITTDGNISDTDTGEPAIATGNGLVEVSGLDNTNQAALRVRRDLTIDVAKAGEFTQSGDFTLHTYIDTSNAGLDINKVGAGKMIISSGTFDLAHDRNGAGKNKTCVLRVSEGTLQLAAGVTQLGGYINVVAGTLDVLGSKTTVDGVTTDTRSKAIVNAIGADSALTGTGIVVLDPGADATMALGPQLAEFNGELQVRCSSLTLTSAPGANASITGETELVLSPGSGNTFTLASQADAFAGSIKAENGTVDLSASTLTASSVNIGSTGSLVLGVSSLSGVASALSYEEGSTLRLGSATGNAKLGSYYVGATGAGVLDIVQGIADKMSVKYSDGYIIVTGTEIVWAGTEDHSTWNNSASYKNWKFGDEADFFLSGKTITFNDSATSKTVSVEEAVSASVMNVGGEGSYTFNAATGSDDVGITVNEFNVHDNVNVTIATDFTVTKSADSDAGTRKDGIYQGGSSTTGKGAATLTFGDGTTEAIGSAYIMEVGDSIDSSQVSTLNIENGYTLKLWGASSHWTDGEVGHLQSDTVVIGSWNSKTNVNIKGKLLVENAGVGVGIAGGTVTISNGGVLATQGLYKVYGDNSALSLNMSGVGSMLILGEHGITGNIPTFSSNITGGTIASCSTNEAISTTIDQQLTIGGNVTIDTTQYVFASDGNSIQKGTDGANIILNKGLAGTTGTVTVNGAGTLSLAGTVDFAGDIVASCAGGVVVASGSTLEFGQVHSSEIAKLTVNGGLYMTTTGDVDVTSMVLGNGSTLLYKGGVAGRIDATSMEYAQGATQVNINLLQLSSDSFGGSGYDLGIGSSLDATKFNLVGVDSSAYSFSVVDGTWHVMYNAGDMTSGWDTNWGASGLYAAPDAMVGTELSAKTSLYHQGDLQTSISVTGTTAKVSELVGGTVNGQPSTGPLRTWLDIQGGTFGVIVGGNNANAWSSSGSSFGGENSSSHIQLNGDVTVDLVVGGNWKCGGSSNAPAFTGDTYISVYDGVNVTGCIFGGSTSAHSKGIVFAGDSHVHIYTVLGTTQTEGLDGGMANAMNVIAGGHGYTTNSCNENHVFDGNTNVSVDLTNSESTDASFVKNIIGGNFIGESSNTIKGTGQMLHTGNSNVSIASKAGVTFTGNVIGGDMIRSTMTATTTGNTNVEITSGIFTCRVVSGGSAIANASGTANITGNTSLTITGGKFDNAEDNSRNFVIGGSSQVNGTTTIDGSSNMTISGGTFNSTVVGASRVLNGTATIGDSANTGNAVVLTVSNTSTTVKPAFAGTVVGGSWVEGGSSTINGKTEVNLNGGTFTGDVYGGNYVTGGDATSGDISVAVNGAAVDDVYGGSYISKTSGSTTQGAVEVDLTSGTINGNVYAGGKQVDNASITTESTTVNLAEDVSFGTGDHVVSGGYEIAEGKSGSTVTGTRELDFSSVGGTYNVANVEFKDFDVVDASDDTVSAFKSIATGKMTLDGSHSGSFKNITIGTAGEVGTITGSASVEGESLKTLGEMTKLDITAVAAMEVKHVTMQDVHINASNGGTGVAVTYGDNGGRDVRAIATTATVSGGQEQMRSIPGPGAAGALDGENSKTLTTTAVQTGGSASGKLTVDVAYGLVAANVGDTLEFTVFDRVNILDGFELELGGMLTTLIKDGCTATLQVNGEVAGTITEANMNSIVMAQDSGILHEWYGTPATVVLIVENIPEPATGALSVLALAALAARRRRKH